jgi:hypothetical protein
VGHSGLLTRDAPSPARNRVLHAVIGLTYLAVGLGVYRNILHTFFLADDFSYLDAIKDAPSASVVFSPLAERYFRPSVVLVYYLNYQLSGLDPLSYHLSVVVVHVLNAWLIFLLGRAMAPAAGIAVPALAGFLFLVFGGHAEAVTWIGGMADPLVTLFLLFGLLLFARSLASPRPARLLIGSLAAFAAALLSKESAAIFPVLIVPLAILHQPRPPVRRTATLVALALTVSSVLLVGYFLLRKAVLGFAFVNLEGLGTNSNVLLMGRAFVLRSFFPQGELLTAVFDRHLDVWVLLPAAVLLASRVPAAEFRPLLLLGFCFGAALAPVLPLSIAVATPESERLVYMASAFATLLLVWFLGAAFRRTGLVVVIVLACSLGHTVALERINRNWQEAAAITRETLSGFAEVMRTSGRVGRAVYVLNVPDNVRGAYIFRRGFHEALKVTAPDQLAVMAQTHVLSVYAISDPSPVRVVSLGPRSVRTELGGGWLIGQPNPPTADRALREWSRHSFVTDFTDLADGSLLLYFTPHATAVAGRLPLAVSR